MFITGPTPVLKLTDNDDANEWTKLENEGGTTLIDTRNGASNGAVLFRGVGGGVVDEYARFNPDGHFGIGIVDPTSKLHVSGTNTSGGILVEDSNQASASPAVSVIGKRSDSNNSQSFSGKLLLAGNRTDAAVATGKRIGTVSFGGNHTNGSQANILYSASISGVSEGTFSNSTTMPTALVFYTGTTGRDPDIGNVSTGSERMRIDSDGKVGIGEANPAAKLHTVGGNNTTQAIFSGLTGSSDRGLRIATAVSSANNDIVILDAQSTFDPTLVFQTRSQERMRIDSSGNVGIGTTSPDKMLHLSGGNVLLQNATGNTAIAIAANNNVSDAGNKIAFFAAGRFGEDEEMAYIKPLLTSNNGGAGNVQLGHLSFGTSGEERMRIDQNGYAIIPAGVTLGTAAGVYSAANTLDDYETGSFTPTFTSTGTNPSGITYDPTVGNEGHYTKIGKVVHIQINIRTDAISNKGSGNLQVSGLPFVSSDYASQEGVAVFPCYSAGFLNTHPSYGLLAEAGTTLSLVYRATSDGSTENVPTTALNTGANDNLCRITGTYMTEE
jgi:hypothetical protein